MKHATREQWLEAAVDEFRPWFKEQKKPIPEKVRVSIGFPYRGRKHTIGQCFAPAASEDNTCHIFITPRLGDDVAAPSGILPTLLHECAHAAAGIEAGHRRPFADLAKALGLEGKMTATTASPELVKRLTAIVKKIGPIPHAKLNPKTIVGKQGTRLIKCECPKCSYTVRVTRKWLNVGNPTCPCGEEMVSE